MRATIICFGLAVLLWPLEAACATCKAPQLQQGMNYDAARATILMSGFTTPKLPPHGHLPEDQKVVTECNQDVKICNNYPEIESCNRHWTCLMVFTDEEGDKLRVSTEGEIGTSQFKVENFEMLCK